MPKLIDLFIQQEDSLYDNARYPYKKPEDSEPFVYTRVSEAEPMNPMFEDQSNPVSLSARRDFTRMFEFSKSPQGLIFLGKQTFLQTGNTFSQTRLYNPLNVQLHSVPFVHLPRHVDVKQTIQSLFGGSSDPERYAKLQKQTVDESTTRAEARYTGKGGILNITNQPTAISLSGIGRRLQNNIIASFRQIGSGFSAQFENPTGGRPEADTENLVATHYNKLADKFRFTGDQLWSHTDQYYPLNSNGNRLPVNILYSWRDNKITIPGFRQEVSLRNTIVSTGAQREIAGLYFRSNSQQRVIESPSTTTDQGRQFSSIRLSDNRSIRIGLANRYVYDFNQSPPSIKDDNNVGSISYQTKLDEWKIKNEKYIQEVQNYLAKVEDADGNLIKGGRDGGKNISIASPGTPEDGKFVAKSKEGGDVTTADSRYYQDLTQIDKSIFKRNIPFIYDVDSVDVIFEAGEPADLLSGVESPAVRFRALIEDINESVTPVYNENKYIGRYETFYTYNKVTRDLSFSLTLHAFSAEELDHIHHKMSYLTSLAYPETTGNYLTPNIFKVTIGLVYHKQPCILQSLTHTIESDTSWDIDRQRPMTIKANIGLRLLDKKAHYILEPSIYGREILEWNLEGNISEQGTR